MEETVRWNIKVSKATDLTLRTYLGAHGMKKGDLSRFIEESVRWRVFHAAIQDIKGRNADSNPEELQTLVDAAVREVRAKRASKMKASRT